jgi:hypothetical protein
MTYQLQYGGYTFPKGMYPADDSLPSVVPTSKHPRVDGSRLLAPTLGEKRIIVKGGAIAPPGTSIRATVDGLKAAVLSGPQSLRFQSDRYWRNVVCRDLKIQHVGTWYDRIAEIECDFVTGDPFEYETVNNTLALTPASTTVSGTATAGGNAYSRPVVSLTAATTSLAVTFYNDTTGESFTIVGTCNVADVIVIDCLNESCMIGGADRMDLFDGMFPRLSVGGNTIRLTYLAASLSAVSVVWANRWY